MSIEGEAILCLKQTLNICKNLETDYVKVGEKEPIWDGSIYVYKDKNHSNKNLIDRCHVQVKGRTHRIKNKDSFPFSLERLHLEKYLIEDGTMFFLINIYEEKHEIYYSCLFPYNINRLLKETQNALVKIPLKKFPKTQNEINCIFNNFIYNKKRQKSAHAVFDLNEIDKSKKYEISYFIPESSLELHNPVEYIKKNDVFIYCLDGSFVYPVAEVKDIFLTNDQIIEKNILINDRIYYERYRVINEVNKSTFYFGKGFSIEIVKYGVDKPNIEFIYKGTLNERIKDTEFIIELLKSQNFYIDEFKFPVKLTGGLLKDKFDELNKLLVKYREVKFFLIENNIKKDLSFEGLSDKEINYIFSFVEKFNTNKIKLVDNKDEVTYFVPKFGNIKILFLCKKNEDGTFIIENFFKENFFQKNYICYGEYKNTFIEISQFVVLKKDEILTYDNIDYDYIFENIISKGKNDKYFEIINQFILELLLAYDDSKGIEKEPLRLSKRLIQWLMENNEWEKYETIFKINYFQILRREKTLDNENRFEINKIIIENSKDLLVLIACYILLNETTSAKYYFNILSEKDQNSFKSFPIFNLSKF